MFPATWTGKGATPRGLVTWFGVDALPHSSLDCMGHGHRKCKQIPSRDQSLEWRHGVRTKGQVRNGLKFCIHANLLCGPGCSKTVSALGIQTRATLRVTSKATA